MSLGTTPTPAGSGLKSALKIAVPLVALVGVVFGVTYITMYAPPPDDTDTKSGPQTGPTSSGPPLRFFTMSRKWDPPLLKDEYREFPLLARSAIGSLSAETGRAFSFTLQDRLFQGFYEPSTDDRQRRRTQFWFENSNPNSVTMQLKGVSCSACTGGRLAAIPPEVTKNLLQHTALAALPVGPFNAYGVGLVQPGASLTQLQWTEYEFQHDPQATFKVRAANNVDKWSPQWGILELTFKVTERKEPLRAGFATQVDGTQQTGSNEFAIMFEVSPACAVVPPSISAGKIEPLSGDRDYELIVFSSTRGPGSEYGDLDKPSCQVDAEAGEFVKVLDAKITRIPDPELVDLGNSLKKRVRAAYKVPVVLRPKVGEARMDIGLFERNISITSGGVTQQVKITAMVRGAVWLASDQTEIDLLDFQGNRGLKEKPFDLITEKPGIELAVVKDESTPAKFTYELEKQPDRGGQGHYKLKITIPPGQFGKIKGEVVLEVKDPNPQRMRIPIRGSSAFGSNQP